MVVRKAEQAGKLIVKKRKQEEETMSLIGKEISDFTVQAFVNGKF